MFDLSTFHTLLRYSHIVVGFAGLIVFWIPTFAKKGSALHIRSGKIFVACAYWVGTTALVACAWALAAPASFLISMGARLEVVAQPEINAEIRMFFAILAFLAATIVIGVSLGTAVLRTKKTPERLTASALRGAHIVYGFGSVCLAVFGLWNIPAAGFGSGYLICAILGLLGVSDARDTLKFLANPRPTPMAWWYKHMECMIGCGIGFHTAFFVFGFGRLFPGLLEGPAQLLPWILPSAIGIPVMVKWVKFYKLKFGELSGPKVEAGLHSHTT